VGVAAGVVAAVVAVVALILIMPSAARCEGEPGCSGEEREHGNPTAEAQLEVVRNEARAAQAERARRAAFIIELTARAIGTQTGHPPGIVVLYFGIENTRDRVAAHAVANVVLPPAAGLDKPTDVSGVVPRRL
jgi:hypothetical protein